MTKKREHPKGWPGIPCEQTVCKGKWTFMQKADTDWLQAAFEWVEDKDNIIDSRTKLSAIKALPVILCFREANESILGRRFASVPQSALAEWLHCDKRTAGHVLKVLTGDKDNPGPLEVLFPVGPDNRLKFGTCYGFRSPETFLGKKTKAKKRCKSHGDSPLNLRGESAGVHAPHADDGKSELRGESHELRGESAGVHAPSNTSNVSIDRNSQTDTGSNPESNSGSIPVGGGGRPTPNAQRRRTEDPQPESSNDDSQAAGAPVPGCIPSRAEYEKLRNKFTEHYDRMTEEEKALYQWGFKFYEQKRSDKPSHAADCLEPTGF